MCVEGGHIESICSRRIMYGSPAVAYLSEKCVDK